MRFELGNGSLYIYDGNGCVLLRDTIECTPTVELSADESMPISWNMKSTRSLCELNSINNLFDELCNTNISKTFVLEYNVPIMIQARWHKKPRVRKKWLKRFGMKPDIVKILADATVLEMHPGHILDDQYNYDGICATFNNFDFEAKNQKYILRPDQKRKGLKIEW